MSYQSITDINGTVINVKVDSLRKIKPGDTISLMVVRDGKKKSKLVNFTVACVSEQSAH